MSSGATSSGTVWDFDPDLKTPKHDEVSGKTGSDGGGGAGVGLHIFADLALQLGRLASSLDQKTDDRQAALATVPGNYQNAMAGSYPSSGSLALDLGSPAQGTWWAVRRLIVGGSDITTTPAGTAWLFIQGSNPIANGANPSVAQAADVTINTFPQRAFYGTHQLVVLPGEHVWVVIVSGTASTQYVASVKCETYVSGAAALAFTE